DMLKEFIAQKEWICPPEPSLRIVVDMIEFCARAVPRWHPVSISGYHIREAGSTAVQELAFTLADGIAYVEAAVKRGLRVDEFARRDARAALRAGGHGGAPHAADPGRGERGRERHRSPRRELGHRSAHGPNRARGARVHRAHRRLRRHGEGDRGRLPAARDRR